MLKGEKNMTDYNIQQAQNEYENEILKFKNASIELNDNQQAILYAKILIKHTICFKENILFCNDKELFVSKTPTGYDIVGYYLDAQGVKNPFNITVCKVNGLWLPSKRYVGADTKSCSNAILLWIIFSIGCTLMGILLYYLISLSIGI